MMNDKVSRRRDSHCFFMFSLYKMHVQQIISLLPYLLHSYRRKSWIGKYEWAFTIIYTKPKQLDAEYWLCAMPLYSFLCIRNTYDYGENVFYYLKYDKKAREIPSIVLQICLMYVCMMSVKQSK